jgi:hypothetical protein
MLDQHSHAARPTLRSSGEVGCLFIDYFPGLRVCNSNQNVIVGLRDSPHDSNERLIGAALQGDAGLAAVAVAKRFGSDRFRINGCHVSEDVAARFREHPARRLAHFPHRGFGAGRLPQQRRRRRGIFQLKVKYSELDYRRPRRRRIHRSTERVDAFSMAADGIDNRLFAQRSGLAARGRGSIARARNEDTPGKSDYRNRRACNTDDSSFVHGKPTLLGISAYLAPERLRKHVSRAVGPAIGGLIIGAFGIAAPFWLNAFSNLGVIAALVHWRPPNKSGTRLPPERFGNAVRTGLRYARYNLDLGATLIRATGFFVFASAYWALLPLVARNQIAGGAALYGILLGAIGASAVGGSFLLRLLRARLGDWVPSKSVTRMSRLATIITGPT